MFKIYVIFSLKNIKLNWIELKLCVYFVLCVPCTTHHYTTLHEIHHKITESAIQETN